MAGGSRIEAYVSIYGNNESRGAIRLLQRQTRKQTKRLFVFSARRVGQGRGREAASASMLRSVRAIDRTLRPPGGMLLLPPPRPPLAHQHRRSAAGLRIAAQPPTTRALAAASPAAQRTGLRVATFAATAPPRPLAGRRAFPLPDPQRPDERAEPGAGPHRARLPPTAPSAATSSPTSRPSFSTPSRPAARPHLPLRSCTSADRPRSLSRATRHSTRLSTLRLRPPRLVVKPP